MTQLTVQEIVALDELKKQFESSVQYIEQVLKEKFFPEKEVDNVGYLVRDWTTKTDGYQNGQVVDWLNIVVELYEKLTVDNK